MKPRFIKVDLFLTVLFLVISGAFVLLFFSQRFHSNYLDDSFYEIATMDKGWFRVYDDGSREPVKIGDNLHGKDNEKVVIEARLPIALPSGESFIMRSSSQNVFVKINGATRYVYGSSDSSVELPPSRFLYVPLSPSDAGKKIQVITISSGIYSGFTSTFYLARETDFAHFVYRKYQYSIYALLFLFGFSIMAMAVSLIVNIKFKRMLRCASLCLSGLLISIFLLANNPIRQYFFSNLKVLDVIRQIGLYFFWIPILKYLDDVMEHRHFKLIFVNKLVLFSFLVASVAIILSPYYSIFIGITFATIAGVIELIVILTLLIMEINSHQIKSYLGSAIFCFLLIPAQILEIINVTTSKFIFACPFYVIVFSGMISADIVSQVSAVMNAERKRIEAVSANESKSAFLANMSHEIRTPVNSIMGMNEMILRECDDANLTDYAKNIKSSSEYLLGILNDILDFSKIEAGKLEMVEDKYSLPSMFVDLMRILNERAEKKDLAVVFNVSPDIPREVIGDVTRVKQIVINLISNAVKYTKKGTVTFNADCEFLDNVCILKITVSDTGIGMTEEGLSKLFDKFTRLDLKKNINIEGTGLGMAITKSLLTMMGGSIDVKSVYGEGSTFTVSIPQVISDKTPTGNFVTAANELSGMKDNTAKITPFTAPDASVLVVDDNRLNRVVFTKLLKRTEIKVEEADGGLKAIELCKEKHYDVIFMDHMMPEPDGIETLHMLRDLDTPNNDTPVIVLTANAISGLKPQYISQGFSDYMSKPIKADLLDEKLMEYLPDELIHKN